MTWKSIPFRIAAVYFALVLYFHGVMAGVPLLVRFPLFMAVVTVATMWRPRKKALEGSN